MGETKYLDGEGLSRVAQYVNKKLTTVSSMPLSPSENDKVLYVGSTTASYEHGCIYEYDGTNWNCINSNTKERVLSQAEYDALTQEEKLNGTTYYIYDAVGGGEKEVVNGYLNPSDGKFYKESTYETEISSTEEVLYIDLNTEKIYRYSDTESEYIMVGGSGDDVSAEIADIVNVYGAKNLIPFPYQADISGSPFNGVSYTINDDASITFSGTSTSVIWFSLCGRINYVYPYSIKAGKYILSCEGLPTDTSSYVGIFEEGNISPLIRADYSNPSTVWDLQTDKMIFIGFRIPNEYTINTTIKPMLRLASIEDDTFERYQPTNADLRLAIKDNSVAESLTGAKNLNSFPYNNGTTTISGVTFTVNDNGTVTANGTASANAVFACHSRIKGAVNSLVLPNGTYVLNGCPAGGGSDKYRVLVSRTYNGNSENLASDWHNHGDYGTEFTLVGDDYSQNEVVLGVFIHVAAGATVDNVVFKPMIRAKGNTDPIWQPYVLTNTQLTNGLTQAYKNNGITGAKNLIVYPYEVSSATSRGVDFSANSDGSVNFSGTGDDANPALMQLYLRFPLKAGTYTISGGNNPYGGISLYFFDQVSGSVNYSGEYEGLIKNSSDQVYIWTTAAGSGFSATSLYGYEKTFTVKSDCYVNIQARSVTNAIVSEVSGIIYPMIRLGGDTDSTYQPYAETNKQLTDRPRVYFGTEAEFDALPDFQKKKYQYLDTPEYSESIVYEELEITTAANQYVSPFTHYGAGFIQSDGKIVSTYVIAPDTTCMPIVYSSSGNSKLVCLCAMKAATFTVRVGVLQEVSA